VNRGKWFKHGADSLGLPWGEPPVALWAGVASVDPEVDATGTASPACADSLGQPVGRATSGTLGRRGFGGSRGGCHGHGLTRLR